MNKLKKILLAIMLAFSTLSLSGCSQGDKESSVELQAQVSFNLLDVLKIKNESSNMIYYYFLAGIVNDSRSVYHLSNLEYTISEEGTSTIHPIDRFQSTISEDLQPGTSTFVYGYIGFPDANERNVGLEFPRSRQFLSFDSVRVRSIDDRNIQNSQESVFTVYSDEFFEFEVDSSNMSYRYEDGKSIVEGLQITYTNKTDNRLVVPYLTPVCTLAGLDINEYEDADKLRNMSLDELKKQDFDVNGLAPKTTTFTGTALGYQLYYLTAAQIYTCTIDFEFEDIIPDFKNDSGRAIAITINSAPLGYSQLIRVDY